MRVSIFGLGYVGTVCAACFAEAGHTVIGVDIDARKLDILKNGRSPIVEPGLEEIIPRVVNEGCLRVTDSSIEAVHASDISLVCVGTPSQPDGSPSLTAIQRVCSEIGSALRCKSSPHVVVPRSTMLPGTTEAIVLPTLQGSSGRHLGDGLEVFYNPEFLREGSSLQDFFHPPFVVIGHSHPSDAQPLTELYRGIEAPVISASLRTAELVKYACNAFHALKIAFANEVGNLAKRAGVDSHDLFRIFCMDSTLNISPAYLKPGFAFGGSCLPKDLRALLHAARTYHLETPLLASILPSNSHQIQLVLNTVLNLQKRKVGFVGLSFKSDTDDLRESPLLELAETLYGKGYQVRIHDPNLLLSRLVGQNRRYMDEHLPHLAALLVDSLDTLVKESEVLIVGHKDPTFEAILPKLTSDHYVIDLVRAGTSNRIAATYDGICW